MKTLLSAVFIIVLGIASSASAAIYAKYDGVDGSSISISSQTTITTSSGAVGTTFVLDGSKSVDDATIRSFSWTQVSGPTVMVANTLSPTFTPGSPGTYVFDLVVVDTNGRASVAARRTFTVDAQGPVVTAVQIDAGTAQEGSTDALLEIKGVEGDSGAAPSKGTNAGAILNRPTLNNTESAANDRLVNAGPKDGWPDAKGGISIAVGDVNGLTQEEKEAFLSGVKAHAEVRSGQELENFAKGVLLGDPQMEQISLNFEKIQFKYRSTAKLFGFIPVGISAIIDTDIGAESSHDRVTVTLPWWSALASTDFDVDGFHDEAVNKIDSITIKQGVKTQADVISAISNVLKTRHDTVKNSISNVR